MKSYTYDTLLSEKESRILSFFYSCNKHYLNAFNFVHKFYRINYRLHKSNHLAVFKTVYIEKSKLPAWKLASSCNIAQSTLFRLRTEIPECFPLVSKTNGKFYGIISVCKACFERF